VQAADRLVTATADGAVQLSDALRARLAEELRAGLRGLRLGPGELLYGRFAGELPARSTDVENRLLTNIAVPEGCLGGRSPSSINPCRPPTPSAVRVPTGRAGRAPRGVAERR
jgi:hypothetical protein